MSWKGTSHMLAPADVPNIMVTAATAERLKNKDGSPGRLRGRVPTSWPVPPTLGKAPNISLLFQRYFLSRNEATDYGATVPGSPALKAIWGAAQGKEQKVVTDLAREWKGAGALRWFSAIANAQLGQFEEWLGRLHTRREAAIKVSSGKPPPCLEVRTAWRATVGLGNPSPQENSGWSFDASYGFPILPAASLKGLLRHYLREELGFDAETGKLGARKAGVALEKTAAAALLAFAAGQSDDGDAAAIAAAADRCTVAQVADLLLGSGAGDGGLGLVQIYDGWPVFGESSWFEVDVLTCHHREYYRGENQVDGEPNPVHFLTLTRDVPFRIPLGLTHRGRRQPPAIGVGALDVTRIVLDEALERWGVGAKTGSGYGRMALCQGEETR